MPDTSVLLGVWRMARVGIHLARGAATIALRYPRADQALRLKLKQAWSNQLLSTLGIEIIALGTMPPRVAAIVANHSSWVDIFAINALSPAAFVCKDDVRRWPLIGWLCANTDSIFIRRGHRRAARKVAEEVQAALHSGRTVAIFPEGTTTDGSTVLPFHAALLQPAIDASYPVQPVALRYRGPDGRSTSRVAYCGDLGFGESLWRICSARGLTVEVAALQQIETADVRRNAVADACHARICAHLASPDPHLPAAKAAAETTRDLVASTVSA